MANSSTCTYKTFNIKFYLLTDFARILLYFVLVWLMMGVSSSASWAQRFGAFMPNGIQFPCLGLARNTKCGPEQR